MSTYKAAAGAVVRLFVPFREAVTSLDALQGFMARLGWQVESLPTAFSDLGATVGELIDDVGALGPNPTKSEVIGALEPARGLVAALRSLSESEAPAGVDAFN
jgi:hypothetical protein